MQNHLSFIVRQFSLDSFFFIQEQPHEGLNEISFIRPYAKMLMLTLILT